MMLGPGNEVILADAAPKPNGAIYVLPGQGAARSIIDGLYQPYGLAYHDGYLYVGESDSVKRYHYDSKTMTAGKGVEIISLTGIDNASLDAQPADRSRRQEDSTSGSAPARTSSPGRGSPAGRHQPLQSGRLRPRNLRRRHCAIRSACTGIPAPIPCGRPCRSATIWATTWSPTTSPTSSRARSTDGRTPTSDPMKTRTNKGLRPDLVAKHPRAYPPDRSQSSPPAASPRTGPPPARLDGSPVMFRKQAPRPASSVHPSPIECGTPGHHLCGIVPGSQS